MSKHSNDRLPTGPAPAAMQRRLLSREARDLAARVLSDARLCRVTLTPAEAAQLRTALAASRAAEGN